MAKRVVELAKPQKPQDPAHGLAVSTVTTRTPEAFATQFYLQQAAQDPRHPGIPVGEGIFLAGFDAGEHSKQGETHHYTDDRDSFDAEPPSRPSLLSQDSVYRHPNEHRGTLISMYMDQSFESEIHILLPGALAALGARLTGITLSAKHLWSGSRSG